MKVKITSPLFYFLGLLYLITVVTVFFTMPFLSLRIGLVLITAGYLFGSYKMCTTTLEIAVPTGGRNERM